MEILIEKMTINDLNKIKENLETDFDDFWNYSIFSQELSNSNSCFYVAKADNKVVGFAGYMLILDEADITNIVVHKNYRNQKIGTKLLQKMIDSLEPNEQIETITLEVNENNKYAIKLYENFNFKNMGVRKNYYENHENAIIMTKILHPQVTIKCI